MLHCLVNILRYRCHVIIINESHHLVMLVKTCKTSVEHKDIVKSVYTGFVYTMKTKVQNNTGPCSNLWKKTLAKC